MCCLLCPGTKVGGWSGCVGWTETNATDGDVWLACSWNPMSTLLLMCHRCWGCGSESLLSCPELFLSRFCSPAIAVGWQLTPACPRRTITLRLRSSCGRATVTLPQDPGHIGPRNGNPILSGLVYIRILHPPILELDLQNKPSAYRSSTGHDTHHAVCCVTWQFSLPAR